MPFPSEPHWGPLPSTQATGALPLEPRMLALQFQQNLELSPHRLGSKRPCSVAKLRLLLYTCGVHGSKTSLLLFLFFQNAAERLAKGGDGFYMLRCILPVLLD